MVSAWATANHVSLGQVVVDANSNEITAIPKLLEMIVSGSEIAVGILPFRLATGGVHRFSLRFANVVVTTTFAAIPGRTFERKGVAKSSNRQDLTRVERKGVEPSTSALRTQRSPN